MNEKTAYKWASIALRELENVSLVEWERTLDLIASTILKAYKKGENNGIQRLDKIR